jgi:hypothetical protein
MRERVCFARGQYKKHFRLLPLLLCPRFAGASFSRATLRFRTVHAGREFATNLDRTR